MTPEELESAGLRARRSVVHLWRTCTWGDAAEVGATQHAALVLAQAAKMLDRKRRAAVWRRIEARRKESRGR